MDKSMQVANTPVYDVARINACMYTDPLYLTYIQNYRDIERVQPAIVPQAWYATGITGCLSGGAPHPFG